jgi:hypothetical protein
MKIRTGFVSNSSSLSFIINGSNKFKIAKLMLQDCLENAYDKAHTRSITKYIKNLEKLPKNIEYGITFPSTNYDTYIIEKNDKIIVDTCNNIEWNSLIKNIPDLKEDEISENDSKFIESQFYYNLGIKNIITSHEIYNFNITKSKCAYCAKEVWGHYISLDKALICPYCGKIGTLFL